MTVGSRDSSVSRPSAIAWWIASAVGSFETLASRNSVVGSTRG
jgi:hypothetical protein